MNILNLIPILILIIDVAFLYKSSSPFSVIISFSNTQFPRTFIRSFFIAILYTFFSKFFLEQPFSFWPVYVLFGLLFMFTIIREVKKIQKQILQETLLEEGLKSIDHASKYENKIFHAHVSKLYSEASIHNLKWDLAIFFILITILLLLNLFPL